MVDTKGAATYEKENNNKQLKIVNKRENKGETVNFQFSEVFMLKEISDTITHKRQK